jgi:hypothetical protein
MVKSSLGYTVQSVFHAIADYCTDKMHIKYILIAFCLVVSAAGAYVGYRWYDARRQADAQFAFGVLLDQFNNALEQDKVNFASFANEFARGYENHKNTALAPYFLSLQADALIKAGNKPEALTVMDKAVHVQSAPSFAPLFKIKRDLLILDGADTNRVSQALEELQTLAQDTNNTHRDYALYHLGMYHWVHDNIQEARVAWQELVNMQSGNVFSDSPWASLVVDQLQSIS